MMKPLIKVKPFDKIIIDTICTKYDEPLAREAAVIKLIDKLVGSGSDTVTLIAVLNTLIDRLTEQLDFEIDCNCRYSDTYRCQKDKDPTGSERKLSCDCICHK